MPHEHWLALSAHGRHIVRHIALGCARLLSEKDAKLAQKLGQLQPFLAVFPQESMGQLAYFGPT